VSIEAEIAHLVCFADEALLPRAWGPPLGTAELRSSPEDFYVIEHSGTQPAGQGEHLLLRIRKTGQNTRWVAKQLAHMLDVPYRSVSYAGMKDRHAVTEQWFSVQLPGRGMPNLDPLPEQGFEILEAVWNNKKLRPGQLSYNAFRISLRNLCVSNSSLLESRLAVIGEQGVPNFFGPQRFGRDCANLRLAADVHQLRRLNREMRSFALSALRGALFNGYLAGRVAAGTWSTALPGEVTVSDRPRGLAEQDESVFPSARLPSGLLWGNDGRSDSPNRIPAERHFYEGFPQVESLLEAAGSRASRRPLVARVANLEWKLGDEAIELSFALSPGCYATVVLRELLGVHDMAIRDAA